MTSFKTGEISTRPQLNTNLVSLLFKHSPIGTYIVANRKFKFVNPEFEKITGYRFDELKNIPPETLIPMEEREEVRKKFIEMLKGVREAPIPHRIVNKKGETRHILESITSVYYNGELAILGFFQDNTEEALIKEQLKRSEEKFQKAFLLSPDWVVITTIDEGIYKEVNQAFLETTGYSKDEVIGKSSIELGIWVDPKEREELNYLLKKYGKVCNAEVQFRKKNGEIIDVLWSAHVIEYDNEQYLLAVARDITEIKKAAQERMLREKLQGVLEMAGATCHEMNQPLQNMMFIVEELFCNYKDDENINELKKQLDRIREISYKLENITQYSTKEYIKGVKIIDIDKASSYCPIITK